MPKTDRLGLRTGHDRMAVWTSLCCIPMMMHLRNRSPKRWSRLSEQNPRIGKWSVCQGSGCHADWQRGKVGSIGRHAVKTQVWSATVVEVQVAANRSRASLTPS